MPGLYVSGAALGALAVGAAVAALLRGPALAFVYPLSALAAIVLGVVDLQVLLTGGEAAVRLPIGLPTIGFHLRLDTLSAFFGIVINGGIVAASLYGMGFDRDEGADAAGRAVVSAVRRGDEPGPDRRRCLRLPVLVGADVACLLGAGHCSPHRPGMPAGRSSLPCHGGDRHGGAAVRLRRPRRAGWRLCLRHDPRPPAAADDRRTGADGRARRLRLERRLDSPARLAAARPSGGAEPRLGADERRHDQGGDLRLRAHRLRPARAARLVVGACRPSCWAR